jgi:adenylate kinase family enzyme
MSNGSTRHQALLLLGPTGSGKTPLGNLIEERGLWESAWVHFDFGSQMRRIAAADPPVESFCREDVELIGRVLETGGLLENEHFPLAERILRCFLVERAGDRQTCVVLNGLPRHVDQAKAIDAIVDVRTVISLRCTQDTVLRRVFSNVAGDRAGRSDDDPERVVARLEQFHERTAPMVQHYRSLDVPVRQIVVTAAMTADEIWRILEHRGC